MRRWLNQVVVVGVVEVVTKVAVKVAVKVVVVEVAAGPVQRGSPLVVVELMPLLRSKCR